jgi:hypothetical protein
MVVDVRDHPRPAKVPEWAFADGQPKPEYSLQLKKALPDGTKVLHLVEPSIKAIRRATKLLVLADGEPTSDSGLSFGVALISGVTNIQEETVEELSHTEFKAALDYLQSFS